MLIELFPQEAFDTIYDLIKKDLYLDEVYEEDNSNLLHHAAYYNQPDMIKLLLSKGFDINQTDNNGITPLGYALCIKNGYESVRTLSILMPMRPHKRSIMPLY